LEKAAYASGGRRGFFQQRLKFAQEAFDRGTGTAFDLAAAYAALGQDNDALKYLDISYQRHDLMLTTLHTDRNFRHLHQDQRFRDLIAKVGLPPTD
jgi:hypothetical protein